MAFDSIEATGAKAGDRVRCVSDRDGHPCRLTVNQTYLVVPCGTSVGAHGNSNSRNRGLDGSPPFMVPFRGYGYDWELVA